MNAKKNILLTATLLTLFLPSAFSQIVTEDVLFDSYISPTDNDFANRFTGGLGLAQITTSGITGGCLTTPNTVNWGNDNAIYCSKYIAAGTWYAKTSISFKYDSTQINSVNFDRAVSIFMRPGADFNHYVIASVTYNKKIQIVTYSWANTPALLNLQQDHWYDCVLQTTFTGGIPGDQIDITCSVFDLGLTGLSTPLLMNSSSGTINDSVLFGDSAVQVSYTGTAWGGAKYLDNFQFQGIKSADSCQTIPTQVAELSEAEFSCNILGNQIVFNQYSMASNLKIEFYSMTGKKIFSKICVAPQTLIDISDFAPGVYLLKAGNSKITLAKKFVTLK